MAGWEGWGVGFGLWGGMMGGWGWGGGERGARSREGRWMREMGFSCYDEDWNVLTQVVCQ